MRRGALVVLAVVAAMLVQPRALALACHAQTFEGVLFIVESSSANEIDVRVNDSTDMVECHIGPESDPYIAVADANAISRVIIDAGGGNDTVELGDATFPATTFSIPTTVLMGSGNDQELTIDASAETGTTTPSISSGAVTGIGAAVSFDDVAHLTVLLGSANDHPIVNLPTVDTITINGGAAVQSDVLGINATTAPDVIRMTRPFIIPVIGWSNVSEGVVIPIGFESVDYNLREGNDKLLAVDEWSGITINAFGFKGRDRIEGQNEGDLLVGDAGNDKIFGGDGPDEIDGGAGTDLCNGGQGKDTLKRCETQVS
jgi:Ca2+-binding RTX toxin-like protein